MHARLIARIVIKNIKITKSVSLKHRESSHCWSLAEKRSALPCEDVVLWWRMNKAIEITAANLRQRMLNEKGTEVDFSFLAIS